MQMMSLFFADALKTNPTKMFFFLFLYQPKPFVLVHIFFAFRFENESSFKKWKVQKIKVESLMGKTFTVKVG